MLNAPICVSRPARMLLAAVSVALVSGCATQYPSGSTQQAPQYVLNQDAASLLEDEALNRFLTQSPASGVHTAARTPWGDNVEIIAEAPYLAASGRKCRQLQVMEPGGSVRAALACETPNGWAHQRLVTQAGGR
ncbi:DVU3141 family protein [Halomonas sp. BC1]|uniref:DVU3141 family protein n=1 Tax=Halomonas sp. BC1 TaxID=1670448 RepID=UPI0009C0435B|nr:DVU3141 family protein [Halomonas sp. BC1]